MKIETIKQSIKGDWKILQEDKSIYEGSMNLPSYRDMPTQSGLYVIYCWVEIPIENKQFIYKVVNYRKGTNYFLPIDDSVDIKYIPFGIVLKYMKYQKFLEIIEK